MKITFYKCNANGNTFIIILHSNTIPKSFFTLEKIQDICYLNNKDLVDGLIVVNIKENIFDMDYYNNDGTWETFCLNGLRCVSLLISKKKKIKNVDIICNKIVFKTTILNDNFVKVKLPEPYYKSNDIKVVNLIGDFIDSGAKHFVIKYDEKWPGINRLVKISREIRYNTSLFPNGTNVNYYKILDSNKIEVKTYEKGIESMMPSCGSGSYACAYDFSKKQNYLGEIEVINEGGNFKFTFKKEYSENILIGKAKIEYKRKMELI